MRKLSFAILSAALLAPAAALAGTDPAAQANAAFTVYPQESLDNGEEGAVGYRVTIDTKGRPTACEVTQSSGHRRLDLATCTMLMNQAQFTPADKRSTYEGRVVWKIG